jgi:CRP-like cAMP-binding protein
MMAMMMMMMMTGKGVSQAMQRLQAHQFDSLTDSNSAPGKNALKQKLKNYLKQMSQQFPE